MTTNTIDQSFVQHFQSEVAVAYQQMGSKLKSTVRSKNNIKGASTTFQKIGKAVATIKARGEQVPVMNIAHEPIACELSDFYAGEWVDKLDEIKVGHDERKVVAGAGAYALGRKTDELIINALNSTTNKVGDSSTGLTKDLILKIFHKLNSSDVPDDGERYALVSPSAWNDLLAISEFCNADYVGEKTPYIAGCESRKWLGIQFIMHTGLPAGAAFFYHKNALGHAVGMDIKTDITWHGDYAAHFVNNMMSQGAVLIDTNGVIKALLKV